jgi:hypothetical protein
MSLSSDQIKKQRLLRLIKQCRQIELGLHNTETAQQLLNPAIERVLREPSNELGGNRRVGSGNRSVSC